MDRNQKIKLSICPNCDSNLIWNKESEMLMCECGLRVTEEDFKDAVDEVEKHSYHVPDYMDNLKGINSL